MNIVYASLICLALVSCHKTPSYAPSIDNMSSQAAPPMGADTYNDELKHELLVLEKLLQGGFDKKTLKNIKTTMIKGQSDEAYLAKLYLALPELMLKSEPYSQDQKLWLKAKLYFLRRRFIEAAMTMSEVLKAKPDFHEARNWRARAIFFLGNPDLAVKELQMIIELSPKKSLASLDALYLIGAIVHESNDTQAVRVKIGQEAWVNYLKIASPEQSLRSEIEEGLKEFNNRLAANRTDKTQVLTSFDPFAQNPQYSANKNALLKAFAKDELLLAAQLAEIYLKTKSDRDVELIKARIFIKTQKYEEAAKLFLDISHKHPNYAPVFHYQGMAFMLKGQIKEAVESWSKTLELDQAYAKSHRLEARISVAQKMIAPQKIDMH